MGSDSIEKKPMGSDSIENKAMRIPLYFNSFSSYLTLISSKKLQNLFSIEPDPFDLLLILFHG